MGRASQSFWQFSLIDPSLPQGLFDAILPKKLTPMPFQMAYFFFKPETTRNLTFLPFLTPKNFNHHQFHPPILL